MSIVQNATISAQSLHGMGNIKLEICAKIQAKML